MKLESSARLSNVRAARGGRNMEEVSYLKRYAAQNHRIL